MPSPPTARPSPLRWPRAFSLRTLAGLAYGGGFTLWRYRSDTDSAAAISAPGYFDAARHLLRPGDVVLTGAADTVLMIIAIADIGSSVTVAGLHSSPPGTVLPPAPPPVQPSPTGGDATAALIAGGIAAASATELPRTAGLVLHVDAADPLGFGGALPANQASIEFLLPRSFAPKGAVEHETKPARPKFRANFDGAGRPAIEFTAADATSLSADGFDFADGFASSDQAATFAAVFRLKAATAAAERSLVYVLPRNMGNGLHFPAGLVVSTAGNLVFRMRDNFSANTEAQFTWTPSATETLIVVGRHGAGSAAARQNRLSVRQGGATSTVTATNGVATNYAYVGAAPQLPTSVRLGSRRYADGATEENYFDGFLCELAIWNTDISDQHVGDLIATWRAKWGIA